MLDRANVELELIVKAQSCIPNYQHMENRINPSVPNTATPPLLLVPSRLDVFKKKMEEQNLHTPSTSGMPTPSENGGDWYKRGEKEEYKESNANMSDSECICL